MTAKKSFPFLLLICGVLSFPVKAQKIKLTEVGPVFSTQRVGALAQSDRKGGWIPQIAGKKFSYGLNTYANSEIVYVLNGKYSGFETIVGVENGDAKDKSEEVFSQVDGKVRMANDARVIFQVYADGLKVYDSGVMTINSAAKKIKVQLSGVMELSLVVQDMATGGNPNHSSNTAKVNWAEPSLFMSQGVNKAVHNKAVYAIKAGDRSVLKLDSSGHICGLFDGKNKQFTPLQGSTYLADAHQVKFIGAKHLAGGGMRFSRMLTNVNGQSCRLTETFTPTLNSVRWEADVEGTGTPWASSIITNFYTPVARGTRFWTAWSHPDLKGQGYWNNDTLKTQWKDPLKSRPFVNSSRWYGGNPLMYVPTSGDLFSLPLATVMNTSSGRAFTLSGSPEDTIIYMKLVTTADGSVQFQRRFNRIEKGHHVHFSMDLVTHAADWRGGLAWLSQRYPQYMNPFSKLADEVGGEGAYSSWEGDLEAEKLKKMGFTFNWKASFDFRYMGMFIPPADEWQTFATSAEAKKDPWVRTPYKGAPTSKKQLENYSKLMRGYGFHVLNYFNVTEFGTAIKKPGAKIDKIGEKDLWKDCNAYLQAKLSDGILLNEDGSNSYYYTWGDAIVMDPGSKSYGDFILEQAQRHIDYLPSSSGICIDRMDWLRYFNVNADDGVTWYNGKPARSLYRSWAGLMEKLGPLMHSNNKVIYLNPMTAMRLDAMKYGDGIYSEHNELGPGLNTSAFLGLRKPVVAWTWNEKSLQPDPDYYLQRFLYLGVFPSAPVPDNNHEISPGKSVDSIYLKYGQLFNAIKQRKWVLTANVVKIKGQLAKANFFKVPAGFVMPVVMAGKNVKTITATIRLDNPAIYKAEVILPGNSKAQSLEMKTLKDVTLITFPVSSQCALVKFTKQS